MREIAGLARAALRPLLTGDTGGLGILMERNLELRRSIYDLDERHTEMADAAQGLGAAVNYTGSGGAIVGLLRDEDQLGELREALGNLGCEIVVRRQERRRVCRLSRLMRLNPTLVALLVQNRLRRGIRLVLACDRLRPLSERFRSHAARTTAWERLRGLGPWLAAGGELGADLLRQHEAD